MIDSEDTSIYKMLQHAGGGTGKGCIYNVDAIIELLEAGREALGK